MRSRGGAGGECDRRKGFVDVGLVDYPGLCLSAFLTREREEKSRVGDTFSWRIVSIHAATVRKSSAVGILCRFRESLEKTFETQMAILFFAGSFSDSVGYQLCRCAD